MAPKRAREEEKEAAAAGPSTHLPGLPKSATIVQRIVHALRILGEPSSAQAIVKTVGSECGYADAARVRMHLCM